MTDEIPRDVRDAWSRVGQYMQAWAGYGTRVADRNVKLWAATNEQLSKGPYTVDAAANDMLRLMAVGQQNLEDLWFLMSRPADSGRYVKVLPTAFLFFDLRGEPPARVLIDPVDIPVPPEVARDSLRDEETVIALSGTIARSKASGAEAQEEQSTEAVDATDQIGCACTSSQEAAPSGSKPTAVRRKARKDRCQGSTTGSSTSRTHHCRWRTYASS